MICVRFEHTVRFEHSEHISDVISVHTNTIIDGTYDAMEQFLIYQVRVNLMQQNIVTLDPNDKEAVRSLAQNIVDLYFEVSATKDSFLIQEYSPQIENL